MVYQPKRHQRIDGPVNLLSLGMYQFIALIRRDEANNITH